jgi:hypothetical protein
VHSTGRSNQAGPRSARANVITVPLVLVIVTDFPVLSDEAEPDIPQSGTLLFGRKVKIKCKKASSPGFPWTHRLESWRV